MATICANCTKTTGPCLSEEQARIANLDASCICTGNLYVSGCATTSCAVVKTLQADSLTTKAVLGNPVFPLAKLGSEAYASNPGAVQLNGQELQSSFYATQGKVPLSLGNGSVIVMGLAAVSPAVPSYILDWQARIGTFFYFINAGTINTQLALSAPGTINAPTGTAPTLTVTPNQRGVIFKYSPTQWAVMVQ